MSGGRIILSRGFSMRNVILSLITTVVVSSAVSAEDSRPNIVLIMADDMGYECIGAHGGTSTLLNMITKAHPKTGTYPFTTMFPTVGVLEYPEQYERITVADIPGLIEGASENRGLGHRFLKHVERCKVLLMMIDMQGTDGREPIGDYRVLILSLIHI